MLPVPRTRDIGECIYCGSADSPLGKEHVIPHGLMRYGDGLNEDIILQKASCRACAVVTSQFEQDTQRCVFQPMRTVLNLRTRHRSARPKRLPLVMESLGRELRWFIDLSPSEYPLYLPVIRFPAPGVVVGRPRTPSVQREVDARHIGGPTFQEVWDVGLRYGAEFIGERLNFSPAAFARTLAKIAYGAAVAFLGIRPFKNAPFRRVILGLDPCVGHWVGSSDFGMTPEAGAHAIKIGASGSDLHVFLRLFAQFGAPEYHVVLGQADPEFVNSHEWPFK